MAVSAPRMMQSALNFQLKIKPGRTKEVVQLMAENQAKIYESITRIGLLHFVRFLFLPWPPLEKADTLIIITTYDGDFDTYAEQFGFHLADLLNPLLALMDPAPPLPVQEHVQEVLEFIRAHNVPTPLYSAYPQCTVMDIWSRGCQRGRQNESD